MKTRTRAPKPPASEETPFAASASLSWVFGLKLNQIGNGNQVRISNKESFPWCDSLIRWNIVIGENTPRCNGGRMRDQLNINSHFVISTSGMFTCFHHCLVCLFSGNSLLLAQTTAAKNTGVEVARPPTFSRNSGIFGTAPSFPICRAMISARILSLSIRV